MAEYGREQRNQLSRAIANSETGSRQLKGIVDNRTSKIEHSQNPIQLFSVTKTGNAIIKNNLAITRQNQNVYTYSNLHKNVAYSENHHNLEGVSGSTGHAERQVFDEELLTHGTAPRNISIVTERPPCSAPTGMGCSEYFQQVEQNHPGFTFDFTHIVNDGSTKDDLYLIYNAVTRNPRLL